ncbi:MAG: hypothetical protein AAF546_09305 [Verrucomicrobiota bacterium]
MKSILTRALIVLAWLGSLYLSFHLAGWKNSEKEKTAVPSTIVEVTAEILPDPDPYIVKEDDEPILSDPEYLIRYFRDLQTEGSSSIYENPELFRFISTVPIELIPHLADEIMRQRWVSHIDGGQILSYLYLRWAEIDLNAAIQSAYQLPIKEQADWAIGSAMGIYSKQDPVGAFEYYKQYLHGKAAMSNHAGGSVIKALAKFDPERAALEVEALITESEGSHGWLTNDFARGLLETTTMRRATELVAALENSEARQMLVRSLFHNHAWRNDPSFTADFIQQLPQAKDREKATLAVVNAWSSRFPEAGASWAFNLEDPELRSKGIEYAMRRWYSSDVSAAAEWLNQHPSQKALDPAIEDLIQFTMQRGKEAESAFSWALSLSDESSLRKHDTEWTLKEWLSQGAEPDEALSLIEASSVSTKEKKALRRLVEDISVGE